MSERTYTEEERDLNGRTSVVMHVEDDFATDANVTRLLEDEIERRGLQMAYMRALLNECPVMGYAAIDNAEDANAWTILRATLMQRARAFLQVMESRR